MKSNSIVFLTCFSLFAFFFACKNEKPVETPKSETPSLSIEKSWKLSMFSTGKLPPQGYGSPMQQRMAKGIYGENSKIGYSIHLFPGGVVTEFVGQTYHEGKWASPNEKTITLTFVNEPNPETASIQYLGTDSLVLNLGTGKYASDIAFLNDGAVYNKVEDNPFHPANNQWRIKPAASETDAQLKARLKNHLHHFALILEATLFHKMKVASFRASPTLLRQYNGGVGLEPRKALTKEWLACFYDQKDADRAYDILKNLMDTNENAATDSKNNWAQNNLIVFKHLRDGL